MPAKSREKITVPIEYLNPEVHRIGHIKKLVLSDENMRRVIKCTIVRTALAEPE